MDEVSRDVWCFDDDNNHSSSSSGSLPQNPFGGHWSSFSSMDDSFVAGISHEDVVDPIELGDSDILNSSAMQLDELNMLMDSMDSTIKNSQTGNFLQSNLFHPPPLHQINPRNCSFESFSTMEEMALTGAMITVISSSSSSSSSSPTTLPRYQSQQRAQAYQRQEKCYPAMSSFQPYSPARPLMAESYKSARGQSMIKKAHNMLRSVNLLKSVGNIEEGQAITAYQLQHMVSERRRRERLNGSFHSLWQLLPPGSKKDKTSVLCKTVNYVKSLKSDIYDLEVKNRLLEEQRHHHLPLQNFELGENIACKPTETVQIQISKSSETASQKKKIDLVLMVGVQCDLIRVVLRVLECIRAMEAISLLSMDTFPNSQQWKMLATLRLAIEGPTWDERTFKEAITGAANMALTVTA